MGTTANDSSLVFTPPETNARTRRPSWALRLKHALGVDRAIAYTVLARGVQICGSAGTVLLIVHFLSPIQQGYYYTLLSLVSLQTVFELGFSFVILQMAAHEAVHLAFNSDGSIKGDPVARARLASVLQKTVRWYRVAALVMWIALIPLGLLFFSRTTTASAAVPWQGPWILVVSATAILFLLDPIFSFLEGCGLVWQVAAARLGQAILGAAMSWTALMAHHGLYSPGMVNLGYSLVAVAFLWSRRRLWVGLLWLQTGAHGVSWRREIWPFQWKIAVSWISAYFSFQVLTPILFTYRGPKEAGQMGMSLSITGYLSTFVLAWVSTKASPFGMLVARKAFADLDSLFFRSLKQSVTVLVGIMSVTMIGVLGAHRIIPAIANRMVPPSVFALLLLSGIGMFIVQSEAVYLRAYRREPFIYQAPVVAALTTLGAFTVVPRLGLAGAGATYLLCTGIIGLFWATMIFQSTRRRREHRVEGRSKPELVVALGE